MAAVPLIQIGEETKGEEKKEREKKERERDQRETVAL
jgi:hypothetical protein